MRIFQVTKSWKNNCMIGDLRYKKKCLPRNLIKNWKPSNIFCHFKVKATENIENLYNLITIEPRNVIWPIKVLHRRRTQNVRRRENFQSSHETSYFHLLRTRHLLSHSSHELFNTTIWISVYIFVKKSPFMPKHFWSKCAIYNL